jgi:hypothetical protein
MGDSGLRKPYGTKVGVFPCFSFNVGKWSFTTPHMDDRNLAHSWCSVTALDHFNPNLGGHFVLWDFGLVVRFPPSSTIMIPSALFLHSNASIQQGERRYSIVQYAAGSLFRWAESGFMMEGDWHRQAAGRAPQNHQEEQGSHWAGGMEMFTGFEELRKQGEGHFFPVPTINAANPASSPGSSY